MVSALLEEENEDNCEILLKLVLDILRGFRPGQCDPVRSELVSKVGVLSPPHPPPLLLSRRRV